MAVFGVVKNASTLRPWQVLDVDEGGCAVHGSFKTREAAVIAANDLNGSRSSCVLASLQEVDELLSYGTTTDDFSRIRERFERERKF